MRKIKLTKPHTHGGVTYPAGEIIELPDDKYDWLMKATRDERLKEIALAEDLPGTPEHRRKKRAKPKDEDAKDSE